MKFKDVFKESNSLMRMVRLMVYFHEKRIHFLSQFLMRFIRVVYACEIPIGTTIGNNGTFKHNGLRVVVHPKNVIGDNCSIYQNVSIAGRHDRGAPVIGNNVFIGAGACILGGVTLGNNSIVGANAVVIEDVPENAVVGWIAAKIIKYV